METDREECSRCGTVHPAEEACPGAPSRVGMVIAGKYALVRQIAHGGMGEVYEARHTSLHRRFAMKFLLAEHAGNADVLRRFENEAKAAGGLEHPNLAAVTDFGRLFDGTPYLVMEYLEGEDCAHLLAREGPLPIVRAVDLVIQACRGLAVAHDAGIVHRDLKPENLFIARHSDGSDVVKVLDFGIAKLRTPDGAETTATGRAVGTAHYMSVEQARADKHIDHRTDVYSMGVVLFELLSGRKPYDGDSFLRVIYNILQGEPARLDLVRPDLPPALVSALHRAMAREPADRFHDVTAFAQAIAPFGPRSNAPASDPFRLSAPGPTSSSRIPGSHGGAPLPVYTTPARSLTPRYDTPLPVAPTVDLAAPPAGPTVDAEPRAGVSRTAVVLAALVWVVALAALAAVFLLDPGAPARPRSDGRAQPAGARSAR